ncbi:hypothetical protein AAE478_009975 [Parahypoxylon ruwenzoriense]
MKKSQAVTESALPTSFDVVVIGAGISGISTAYYLETQAPGTSYAILEGRSRLGGTWDLFRYPGIRSDSNMTTFGFSWSPWTRDEVLGTAEQILAYMQKSAESFGIDKNIHFNRHVHYANWNTAAKSWALTVTNGQGKKETYHAKFIILGTGYYDYEQPLDTHIPGLSNFGGQVIHPQFWPEELNYSGKDIVVIGSGATAVTLIPSMAEKAKSVTMLQRSPSYIVSQRRRNKEGLLVRLVQEVLPTRVTRWVKRFRSIVMSSFFYYFCQAFPARAKNALRKATIKQLPANMSWDPHFNPRYNPWEQRMCLCPGGDFYAALRSGKAGVITDTIENITETEIQLSSGQTVKPDIIITATGLKLQFGGGIKLSVDGEEIDSASKFTWKGCMIQDVPNLGFIMGYVNVSWTLGAEVTGQMLARLLRLMKKRGAEVAVPRLQNSETMHEKPVFSLTSTYMKDANRLFPMAGSGIWNHKRNYLLDVVSAQWGDISKGLSME